MLLFENVNLLRSNHTYLPTSVKDLFISAAKNPYQYFTNLKKTELILKNISFKIDKNEKIALLGRNGSGKTTLCRLIAKQILPHSGNINIKSHVSFFSQIEQVFFNDLTAKENLVFYSNFIFPWLSKNARKDLVEECIEFSGLEKRINFKIETFSLGMISRLALTLITASPHELLILDEISNHTDAEFQYKFNKRLKENMNLSKSLIFINHNEIDLLKSCNRGILMNDGQIIFDGQIDKALGCYSMIRAE